MLSAFIPDDERIVTIEDAAELQLQQEHVITLETRPANIEGKGEVTIRDLVRNALRMRPDRIIVGECRGAETLDMLQAMNTGHDGSLTTIHANTPRDALGRLETLVLTAGVDLPLRAIREQIAGAFDLIVQISRLVDGSRRITHITEVLRMESDVVTLQDIFIAKPAEDTEETAHAGSRLLGPLRRTGIKPQFLDKLAANGVKLPNQFFQLEHGPGHAEPGVPEDGFLMRRLLVLAAASLAIAAPAADAAVTVRGLDTTRLPLVRITVAADSSTPGKVPGFIVNENGRAVGALTVGAPSEASSIVLAIDTSGSMKGGPIAEALAAAGEFLGSVKQGDQIAIVGFGHTASVVQPLTSDTSQLATALAGLQSDHQSGTALNDAVAIGIKELATAPVATRRVLIVMTDGKDSSSLVTMKDVAKQATDAQVAVYPIALKSTQFSPDVLQQLAGATGGSFRDAEKGGLANVYHAVADELAKTYVLTYRSQPSRSGSR